MGSTAGAAVAQRVAPESSRTTAGVPTDPGGDGASASEQATGVPPAHAIHRWRDLDRRDRAIAVAVGLALLLAPLLAFAHFLPHWAPEGDPALMGLRALDAGTSRTPLLGQPSASGQYTEAANQVAHPGPILFYLMALPVRLLGGSVGMLGTSILITGTCLVGSAWAVFRQLGRRAGLVAALVLAAVAFTTGAASLVNPVSSSIAGYPLLLTAVLMWCVATGDVRLLPAAAAAASFTAQQHLSVVPSVLVITLGGVALLVAGLWRSGRLRRSGERRELAGWGLLTGLVALVLWAPVLAQEAFGDEGNIGLIVWFARHGNRETLGYDAAVRHLAHTIGLPPLLGRTHLTGAWLNSPPSAGAWLSAGAVAVLVAALCLGWRRQQPRRALLGVFAGVVALAGLYNGASVPVGIEQERLPFYHWTLVLSFLVALIVGLAASDLVARLVARRPAATGAVARPALAAVVVLAVALPPIVNTRLDRLSSTFTAAYSPVDRHIVDDLTGEIAAHRADLGDHTVLLARNEPLYGGVSMALAFSLAQRGIDVELPLANRTFVHDQRLADLESVDGGLVVVVDTQFPGTPPEGGTLVARAIVPSQFDGRAFRALIAQVESAGEVVLGAEMEEFLSAGDRGYETVMRSALSALQAEPGRTLLQASVLDLLAAHPLASPRLDPSLVRRLRATIVNDVSLDEVTRISVYRVDRDQVLRIAFPWELGGPPA